jgi:hypothetical protein
MKDKVLGLAAILAAGCVIVGGPAYAVDLSGSWTTDTTVCDKIFVKKGDTISFQTESDQYGGGFIMDENRIRGQMQTCVIKIRKQDGNIVHMLATCADDIMASNIQFSVRIVDDNTIMRMFPGLPDDLSIKYSRCPM